jgi:hypothetical protein
LTLARGEATILDRPHKEKPAHIGRKVCATLLEWDSWWVGATVNVRVVETVGEDNAFTVIHVQDKPIVNVRPPVMVRITGIGAMYGFGEVDDPAGREGLPVGGRVFVPRNIITPIYRRSVPVGSILAFEVSRANEGAREWVALSVDVGHEANSFAPSIVNAY